MYPLCVTVGVIVWSCDCHVILQWLEEQGLVDRLVDFIKDNSDPEVCTYRSMHACIHSTHKADIGIGLPLLNRILPL